MSEDLSDLAMMTSIGLHESELHGLVSGIIIRAWDLDEETHAKAIDILRPGLCNRDYLPQFYRVVKEQMVDPNFSYQILLPDEDESVEDRVYALKLWLYGCFDGLDFSMDGFPVNKNPSYEGLRNRFQELSEVELKFTDKDLEDWDETWVDLVEYIRLDTLSFVELAKQDSQ